MGVLHRALLTWFLGLVFLILLVIRLDQRTSWNWFIVFIPLWIFDAVVLTYSVFSIVRRCKNEPRSLCSGFVLRKFYVLVTVLLKMATQIMLCLKLSSWAIPLYYVLLPVWAILVVALVRLGYALGAMNVVTTSFDQFRLECLRREGIIP